MLTLFYRPTCPFCHKVQDAAKELGVELTLRDIAESKNAAELVVRGGKRQVPFLFDEEKGVQMYESTDIVEYLKSGAIPHHATRPAAVCVPAR